MEWIINHWLGHINGFDVLLLTGLAVLRHWLFRQPHTAAQAAKLSVSQTTALPRVRDAAARRAETRGRWADVLGETETPSAPTQRDQRIAA